MPHSYGATLIFFWKIPLISYVAHNTKEEHKNAEEWQKEKKKKDTGAIFYILALPYRGPSAEHASRFPCLMQHIESELMKIPPRGMSVIGAASKICCQRNRIKWGGQPFCPCHIDYLSIWPSAVTHACF